MLDGYLPPKGHGVLCSYLLCCHGEQSVLKGKMLESMAQPMGIEKVLFKFVHSLGTIFIVGDMPNSKGKMCVFNTCQNFLLRSQKSSEPQTISEIHRDPGRSLTTRIWNPMSSVDPSV